MSNLTCIFEKIQKPFGGLEVLWVRLTLLRWDEHEENQIYNFILTKKAKECVNESENPPQPAGIEVSKLGQRQRPGQR